MPADVSGNQDATTAFAKHKSAAIRNDNDDSNQTNGGAKMSLLARFLIFVIVPSLTGLAGLGTSYLQSMRGGTNDDEEEPHEVDFDRDFVTPFLLSLAFVIVLVFQTNGFSGERKKKRGPFVWPKARKVQKIRRERVIVDDSDDTKKEQ